MALELGQSKLSELSKVEEISNRDMKIKEL
jgi:hypothetical protein